MNGLICWHWMIRGKREEEGTLSLSLSRAASSFRLSLCIAFHSSSNYGCMQGFLPYYVYSTEQFIFWKEGAFFLFMLTRSSFLTHPLAFPFLLFLCGASVSFFRSDLTSYLGVTVKNLWRQLIPSTLIFDSGIYSFFMQRFRSISLILFLIPYTVYIYRL